MFLKRIIKDSLAFLKCCLSLKQGVSVLMYHSIDNNNVFFTVRPEIFAKQMKFLKKKNYQIISLTELISVLNHGKLLPKKTVVLTFDDGYEDNYYNAWPILKKYNFSATIFVASQLIDSQLKNSQGSFLKVLNWPQIYEMDKSGLVDFQPHGLTHQKLNKLSFNKMQYEIMESKRILDGRLKKICQFFSYPNGRYNHEIIQVLKKTGFKAAITVKKGFVKKGDDLFTINRHSINSTVSFIQFKSKI